MKRALIFGINGQDGSYLAEILLEKGYDVHGFYRRSSVDNLSRIRHLLSDVTLHKGDLTDYGSVHRAVAECLPLHEVYNEADQDHVGWSQAAPSYSAAVTYGGVVNVLEAVRQLTPTTRVFQPVSATMFGYAPPRQDEITRLYPQSPYACAKVAAYYLCQHYRREHGMFVSCGILFNHDSPRRGSDYLLQRIARGEELWGDLETIVDIGYAREYMEAAWKMMQLESPDDFVIGTGKGYHIKDLLNGVRVHPKFPLESALVAYPEKAVNAFGFDPKCDAFDVLEIVKEHYRGQSRTDLDKEGCTPVDRTGDGSSSAHGDS